jgi:hypothetical protein
MPKVLPPSPPVPSTSFLSTGSFRGLCMRRFPDDGETCMWETLTLDYSPGCKRIIISDD